MHIPDGFLDPKSIIATTALSSAGLGIALRQVGSRLPPRRIPLMGLASAFVFVAQMLNFPVAGGTSGHLMGAVLVSTLLGPAAGIVVISSVLIVQSLLFADGGVLALGANIFNMAIVGCVGGYLVYRLIHRILPGERGRITAVAFASWCSSVLAAACCAGELAWSGTVAWSACFPAMVNIHMLIGLGEALITSLVVAAIGRTRPELLARQPSADPAISSSGLMIYGVLLIAGLLLFVSPFASRWPDGLQAVASALGFDQKALAPSLPLTPMPDYRVMGIPSAPMATVVAGGAGAVLVFILAWGTARAMIPGHPPDRDPEQ